LPPATEPDTRTQELPLDMPVVGVGADFLNDITQIYLNEIGQNPLLSAEQELQYARATREGNFDARQKMIEHNLDSSSASQSTTSIAVLRLPISSRRAISVSSMRSRSSTPSAAFASPRTPRGGSDSRSNAPS
jgi:hypothetical protein